MEFTGNARFIRKFEGGMIKDALELAQEWHEEYHLMSVNYHNLFVFA